jgi:hypothetical protein
MEECGLDSVKSGSDMPGAQPTPAHEDQPLSRQLDRDKFGPTKAPYDLELGALVVEVWTAPPWSQQRRGR